MNVPLLRFRSGQIGMTLVEVLVTVFVMSIGLMGLAALQMNTTKEGVDVARQTHGVWLVDELAARMRANPEGLKSGYTTAAAKPNLCDTSVKQCADYHDGSSKENATNCNANEMATFDVWQVVCGYNLSGIGSSNVEHVAIKDYEITCDDSDPTDTESCSPLSPFTIKITWTSRAAKDAKLNTEQTIQQTIVP